MFSEPHRVGLVCGTAMAASPAWAWEQIGERVVTDRVDFDEMVIEGHHRYTQIKLCIYNHPVRFYDLDLRFANGGHQDVQLRTRINPGECSRNIDLKGGARDIRTIKVLYEEASPSAARATLRVFAR